jgi:MFS family permease
MMPDDDVYRETPVYGLEVSLPQRRIAGLPLNLWRLAIVIGIAQFSMSIWSWQFGIFIAEIIEPWQMGLTFSVGTGAAIVGLPASGIVADMIGRRRTFAVALIPMIIGLICLYLLPIWPLIPVFYAIISFGWSFVIITARAAPADQLVEDAGKDSAKVFTMMLFPALAVDGVSPIFASIMLSVGLDARLLLLIGGVGAIIAFVSVLLFVRETLREDIQMAARKGPAFSPRQMGKNFWKLAAGLLVHYFAFNLAYPYLGNLAVEEWSISSSLYGLTWSASSLSTAVLILVIGGLADRKLKLGLVIALLCNSIIMLLLYSQTGFVSLLLIMIFWSFPIVLWIGAENSLIVEGVSEEMKGRALSTFRVVMSSSGLVAANVGAWIWSTTGSLRFVWFVAGIISVVSLLTVTISLKSIRLSQPN